MNQDWSAKMKYTDQGKDDGAGCQTEAFQVMVALSLNSEDY